ncbi:MAG: hypothetical protein WBB23_04665, partial [Desulforhopalus sp.]
TSQIAFLVVAFRGSVKNVLRSEGIVSDSMMPISAVTTISSISVKPFSSHVCSELSGDGM